MTGSESSSGRKRRVLLISHDVLGHKMAGPGIRYFQLSRVLSRHTELRLAILSPGEQVRQELQARLPDVSLIEYQRWDWPTIRQAAEWAEVIVVSPYTAWEIAQPLAQLPAAIVMDGYDPLLIEWLTTLPPEELPGYMEEWSSRMAALFFQYQSGDFFICASERQRHWWLGQLEVAGRINPYTYQEDASLRRLLDVVPYGLPEEPPRQTRPLIKGVWPGITKADVVLLWGGGLWPWLDPLTAVHAIAQLHSSHPQLKLIFPGTIHPNPQVQAMPVRNSEVYALAEASGLLNKAVFFGEWIPYEDWPNVLLESDIALSLHHDTIETQLAFRSRMLDYIWAGLPIIATTGDATSELVAGYKLGCVVNYADVHGVSAAILGLLDGSQATFQKSIAAARRDLTWENAARPLIQFCRQPRRAADRPAAMAPGVPHYELLLANQRREIARLQQEVAGYENGRFMRFMRAWHRWRDRRG